MVSTQDLRNKEVINIDNGKSLGFVEDITLNLERGVVEGIVIPQQTGGILSFFNKSTEIIVPWNCVRRVGEEVILVELGAGGGYPGEVWEAKRGEIPREEGEDFGEK